MSSTKNISSVKHSLGYFGFESLVSCIRYLATSPYCSFDNEMTQAMLMRVCESE